MSTRHKGRIAAFQGIYAWEDSDQEFSDLCHFEWLDKDIGTDAKNFAALLIAGTLEHISDVDSNITQHLNKWSFDRIARVDLAILRISAYALIYQKDIPDSVTIDEAVEIAKKFGSPESYRFVNGVLDGIRKANLS